MKRFVYYEKANRAKHGRVGKWQRVIFNALTTHPEGTWLSDLLGQSHTWSDYVALHRAALELESSGYVVLTRKSRSPRSQTWIEHGPKKMPEVPPQALCRLCGNPVPVEPE